MTTVIEGKRSLFIATPAQLVEEDKETAWAGAEQLITKRPGFAWCLGNFVSADPAGNQNGHVFGLEDLQTEHATIVNTPLNVGHQGEYIVGAFVGSALVYPTDTEVAGDLSHPYVEALAAMWKGLFAREYDMIRAAHSVGSLYFSMEAVPRSLICLTPGGCGLEYAYDGTQSDTYCAELNAPRAKKKLNKPYFVGGALVAPPLRPGWRGADITEISTIIRQHDEEAERLYAEVAAESPHLPAAAVQSLMEQLLAGAYGPVPEPMVTATRMPGLKNDSDVAVASLLAVEVAAHTGVIVAIVPPLEVAEALAALGTETPSQIHCTLVFLGDAPGGGALQPADVDGTPRTLAEVAAAVAAFAAGAPPLGEVTVSGLGRFALADGSEVTYASIDAPALPEFHARLVAALEAAGVPVSHEHGLSPHVSIAYSAGDAGPTEMPGPLSWTVDAVELWWGDADHRRFPLAGGRVPFAGEA